MDHKLWFIGYIKFNNDDVASQILPANSFTRLQPNVYNPTVSVKKS